MSDKIKEYKVEFYTRSDGMDYRIVKAYNSKDAIEKVKEMPFSNFCNIYSVYLIR